MNKYINPTLRKSLESNYDFKFENYISRGFDITGKFGLSYVGFSILSILFMMVVELIPTIGNYINVLVVLPVLNVGFYIVAHHISLNKGFHFDQFFDGFKKVDQLFIVALIPTAISYIINYVLFSLVGDMSPIDLESLSENFSIEEYFQLIIASFSITFFLIFLPMIYLYVAWSFAPLFVIFYDMPAWEALETSRQLITKKWFTFFAFYFVLVLIGIGGLLLICVGIFYFYPAIMNAKYAAFEDITKFYEERNTEDDILEHFVED